MLPATEELYYLMVGPPKPELWPESLRDTPIAGHGQYAFQMGLRLGLQLAMEGLFSAVDLDSLL